MERARYRANCLPGPREPFKRDNVDLAPGGTEEMGGVFSHYFLVIISLTLFPTLFSVGRMASFDGVPRCPIVKSIGTLQKIEP